MGHTNIREMVHLAQSIFKEPKLRNAVVEKSKNYQRIDNTEAEHINMVLEEELLADGGYFSSFMLVKTHY